MFILAVNNISSITSRFSWPYFRNLASIVCSRESTYRVALDVSGFEIPTVLGDIFSLRPLKKIVETLLEALAGGGSIAIAPMATSFIAKILGKFILPANLQKHTLNLLKFSMKEVSDIESLKDSISAVKERESLDKEFVASLYEKTGNIQKANRYRTEANGIRSFCDEIKENVSEDLRENIKKIKKASIIAQSTIEGAWWGGWGLMLRGIRKYILKSDSYTGTQGYAEEAGGEMKLWQKVIGVACIFLSPITNLILLNKCDDKEKVKNSKFLQVVKEDFDMTHGVYPKLGLLFSMTTYPKWIGAICGSQGWSEFLERVLTLTTLIPSWWLGHRATNGVFAKNADEKISKKYGIEGGMLVENEFLHSENILSRNLPEPAKIHHVLDTAKERGKNLTVHMKDNLVAEVEDEHAKALGLGFLSHSAGIWVIKMAINQIVKKFTLWRLGG